MTAFRKTALALLVFVAGLATAFGQTSNGTIVGQVTDSSGAAIVGATVNVVSTQTGAVREVLSGPDGAYRIESLLPGTYKVTGTATGFAPTILDGLVVPSSTITSAPIQLKVGGASDKVEVTADNTLLNIDNGEISGTIDTKEIANLPIASQNPYELALTLPGVSSPPSYYSFTNGVGFEVGGGRPRSNNFLIEGQDNNDAGITGQGLQPGNIEAVSEVRVLENSYTAEYGHGSGSVSNLIFKSGTNQFHGSVYERLQNTSLDSVDKQDHFFGSTPTLSRENQPGFTIGGPVIHDKIFFFASYAWDYFRSTANLTALQLPTANGIATLNAQPANPHLTNLLTAYGGLVGVINPNDQVTPIALGPDPVTGVDRGTVEMGLVRRNLGADTNAPEVDVKGDILLSQKDTLSVRYIRNSFLAPIDVFNSPSQLPGFDSDQDGVSFNSGLVETHTFSPNVVNEFRASFGHIGFVFGLPAATTSNPLYNQPAVSITGMNGYGIPGGIPQGRSHDTYQFQDSVSWTKGKNNIKIGADIADIRVEDQVPFNFFGSISYANDKQQSTVKGQNVTYSALANLIDDYSGPSTTVTQDFGSPTSVPRLISQNYFAQDTFRATPNLSLDFGLRYEYNGAPFNAKGTPYPGIDLNNIGCNPVLPGATCNTKQQSDYSDWGPRVGVVYSPELFGHHKTVFRSGFGIFYDSLFTNIIDNIQATFPNAAAPQITADTTVNPRGTSGWAEQFANLTHTPDAFDLSEPIIDKLKMPRTIHYNFNIEQELPWSTALNISYVGERGERLFANELPNHFVNQYFESDYVIPTRGEIEVRDNSGDSNYNGLWVELDHKFDHNFLFRASYTYAHSLDNTSEVFSGGSESSLPTTSFPTNRGLTEYANSAYDHRHRLSLAYVWTPSVWHTQGAMKAVGNIVNHWQVSGVTQFQAGSPENVEDGFDVNGDGVANDRPYVSNPKAPLDTYAVVDTWFGGSGSGLCSGPSFFYTNNDCESVDAASVHWVVAGIGTRSPVTVGRNSLTGPGFQQWDMNLQRTFKIGERVSMDFRGELFNIFNHGEGGVENTTLGTGINSDAFFDGGTNTFADIAPTVTGHRHVRLFFKVSF